MKVEEKNAIEEVVAENEQTTSEEDKAKVKAEKKEHKAQKKAEKKIKKKIRAKKRRKRFAVVLAVFLFIMSLQTGSVSMQEEARIAMEGEFRCDWFGESLIYPYTYSDSYFERDAYEYNHELALYALGVSMASFNSFDTSKPDEHIRKMLDECGYDVETFAYETAGYDEIALAVGRKDIKLNGEKTTLLIAAVRSGNYGMEWGGNVRIGTGINHEGFDISKDKIMHYFNEYFEGFEPYGEVKLLVAGYSRGSSIGNLFSAELVDGSYVETLGGIEDNISKASLKKENIYSYFYEIPQCTMDPAAGDEIYNNIFNIVNPNDYFSMFVMDVYDFTCYGRKFYLPSVSRCENYDDFYEAACAEFESFMSRMGKKPNKFFYSEEDSLSCEAIFNYLFHALATDVMISREYYAQNLEKPMVYFSGQYMGKNKSMGELFDSFGVMAVASVRGVTPSNAAVIDADGFVAYLSDALKASGTCEELTDEETERLFEILDKLIRYIYDNFSDVTAVFSQFNTSLNVHQPYVQMTWMRLLTEDQMLELNSDIDAPLRLNCYYVTLNKSNKGKIDFEHTTPGGKVEWSSADESIAAIDNEGIIVAKSKGETRFKAVLYDAEGNVVTTSHVPVTIR